MNSAHILLYHGVTDVNSIGIENSSCKHIKANIFEKQIKFLSEYKNVVNLYEFVDLLNKNKNIKDYVTITFDDTFKNIYTTASPILKKYNVSATFFITTGMINTQKMFWVDRLEHMINFSKKQIIKIFINGNYVKFNVKTYDDKISTLIEIKKFLKKSKPDIRLNLLENILNETGWNNDYLSENYLNLTWKEIKELDNDPLFDIGGHTVNHEILSYLDDESLDYEIFDCVNDLENNLNHKIDLFSYPEGQKNHFNINVINKLKDAGIKICPSAINGVNFYKDDPFYLKRIMVGFMNQKFPFKECI